MYSINYQKMAARTVCDARGKEFSGIYEWEFLGQCGRRLVYAQGKEYRPRAYARIYGQKLPKGARSVIVIESAEWLSWGRTLDGVPIPLGGIGIDGFMELTPGVWVG